MIKFAMRVCLSTITLVIAVSSALPAIAANPNNKGDGSGIGGTGNSPSGGGIGGTGSREQNSPATMPDLPDRPEIVDTPNVEPPDLPSMDTGGINGADMPPAAAPPDVPPTTPPQP